MGLRATLSRRARDSCRDRRATLTAPASSPQPTPIANATSTMNTSGASTLPTSKKRSVTGSAFCSATSSSTRKTTAPAAQRITRMSLRPGCACEKNPCVPRRRARIDGSCSSV